MSKPRDVYPTDPPPKVPAPEDRLPLTATEAVLRMRETEKFNWDREPDITYRGPLPTDAAARKAVPLATGVLDYFPDALAAVAEVSRIGNEQHNPGEPLHWARGKSTDHADSLLRHLVDRGRLDSDGARHSAKVAWRALALLQTELEDEATIA